MKDLLKYFTYLGSTGFGGPLVLVQQMRMHFVDKEKKMTASDFDQAFALIKAMPGPVAFQMAVFLGNRFFGFWGALLSGFCLIFPSFLIILTVGFYYEKLTSSSVVGPFLDGLLYSSSAIILMSLKNLLYPNRKDVLFWSLAILGFILAWKKTLPEPAIILLFGAFAVLVNRWRNANKLISVAFLLVDWDKIYQLAKICLTAGAVVFGTGFALIPVLKTNLVDVHQLLSIKQFNDGVVFGQMTPGPITITAAFLGYEISGVVGSLVATTAIFFFPFLHMSTWFPKAMAWLSKQKWISNFVVGATAAVVSSILATLIQMNFTVLTQINFIIIFSVSLAILIWQKTIPILLLFLVSGLTNLILI